MFLIFAMIIFVCADYGTHIIYFLSFYIIFLSSRTRCINIESSARYDSLIMGIDIHTGSAHKANQGNTE